MMTETVFMLFGGIFASCEIGNQSGSTGTTVLCQIDKDSSQSIVSLWELAN